MLEKLLLPSWYCPKLREIDFDLLKSKGIDYLFFDLDNTLVPFYESFADEITSQMISTLKEKGFKIFVISNNHQSRVAPFASKLDINYLNSACKPLTFKLKKLMKLNQIKKEQVVLIGDQLLTDVIAAKRLKISSILVEPAVVDDLKKTKLNRFFDKKIRKKMIKKNLMNYFEVKL